jgi:hypothetical protein
MEIKPGISTSLYISMILFVTTFSGQNSNTSQASRPVDITINSASDSLIELIEKSKTLKYFQNNDYRIEKRPQTDSLSTYGTK